MLADCIERVEINGWPVSVKRVYCDDELPPPFDNYAEDRDILGNLTHIATVTDPRVRRLVEELQEILWHIPFRMHRSLGFLICQRHVAYCFLSDIFRILLIEVCVVLYHVQARVQL